jgi:protease I
MALNVGVLVYGGYQELEFWYPLLRLREADVAVSVLGVEGDQAAYSILGYPVVPNAPLSKVSPSDFSAIVIPGGKVENIAGNAALKSFLNEASASGAVIAGISQAGALVPQGKSGKSIVAKTADELPQWTKALLNELSVRT